MGSALVCDICGGKLVMGAGGIATCESCGMEHSPDRMKEKVQEIKGVVQVDNSHLFSNFLEMAENALDASNNQEAENYCNKIIENDPRQYKAWFLKGKAAGWQSTLANNRFIEAANCFGKAIEYAPEEEKENIKKEGTQEIKNLGLALMRLRGEHFADYPDEDELNHMLNDRITVLNTITQYLLKGGDIPEDYASEIAKIMNTAACNGWRKIIDDFENDDDTGHPSDYAWKKMIDRAGNCTFLIEKAIEFDDTDDEEDIVRYENLIVIHNYCISSCSYKKEFTSYGSYWARSYSLASSAIQSRRNLINDYNKKIAEIKLHVAEKAQQKKKEKIDQYWSEHQEERKNLEKEKSDLEQQIYALRNSIKDEVASYEQEKSDVPGYKEVTQFQTEISKLQEEKDALGILKLKERKALQDQIDSIKQKQDEVKNRMDKDKAAIQAKIDALQKSIETQITPLRNRISEINQEFTKER